MSHMHNYSHVTYTIHYSHKYRPMQSVLDCSRTLRSDPLQVSRRLAVTAVCCVLYLALLGGLCTHHCITSLVCRRSVADPALTRHHDPTPKLIGRHCCGFVVSRNNTNTPSWGWIFNGHIKSPEKQNTKINITVRSQTTTISQLQYPLQYNLYSRYKISIIHPSLIHS